MVPIALTNSTDVAWVSDEDRDLAGLTWHIKRSARTEYAVTSVRQGKCVKSLRLHRIVASRMGHNVADRDVHHVNHITLDCRRENLVVLSHDEHAKVGRVTYARV